MPKKFTIRLANIEDMQGVFNLSNDDVVRGNSINPNKIEWENHVEWFTAKINEEGCEFFAVVNENKEFIAQVRVEKNIMSISLSEKFRGKGLGSEIIKAASQKSKQTPIMAYVKIDNISSEKAFLKAGYVVTGMKTINSENYRELKHEK